MMLCLKQYSVVQYIALKWGHHLAAQLIEYNL